MNRMKKTLCFLLLSCLIFVFCGCSNGYTDFTDDIYGISMQYPEDWTVSDEDEDLIANFTAPDGKTSLSLFAENHMIYQLDLTLEEYMEASEATLTFIQDYRLLYTKDVTIGDLVGKCICYSGYFNDDESKTVYVWTQFITIKEGYAYVLTHTAEKALADDGQLFDTVLNTLAIADNPRYADELSFYEAYHESLNQSENTEGNDQ